MDSDPAFMLARENATLEYRKVQSWYSEYLSCVPIYGNLGFVGPRAMSDEVMYILRTAPTKKRAVEYDLLFSGRDGSLVAASCICGGTRLNLGMVLLREDINSASSTSAEPDTGLFSQPVSFVYCTFSTYYEVKAALEFFAGRMERRGKIVIENAFYEDQFSEFNEPRKAVFEFLLDERARFRLMLNYRNFFYVLKRI
jgi:hypothetical protein